MINKVLLKADTAMASQLFKPLFMKGNASRSLDVSGYVNVTLNTAEQAFIAQHPIATIPGSLCAVGAMIASDHTDDEGDALRHCLWSACSSYSMPKGLAKQMLDAHESNEPSDPMDAFNNEYGVKIGSSPGMTYTGLVFLCLKARDDGKLYITSPSPSFTATHPKYRRPDDPLPPPLRENDHKGNSNSTSTSENGVSGVNTGEVIEAKFDLRRDRNNETKYFVVLMARDPGKMGSVTGHAFIGYGYEDPSNKLSYGRVLGFYPDEKDENKWSFILSKGNVKDDWGSIGFIGERIIVNVDKVNYDRVVDKVKDWLQNTPKYNLITKNCVDFVNDVNDAAGLPHPNVRLNFPTAYVTQEMGMIKGSGSINLDNKVIYTGEITNYAVDGQGSIVMPGELTYVGHLNQNHLDGTGILNDLINGSSYTGTFKDGAMHGHGLIRTLNGDMYDCDMVAGVIEGNVNCKFANGDQYIGQMKSDRLNGQGIYRFKSGGMYRGNFNNGVFNGEGEFDFDDGTRFIGNLTNNSFNGLGKAYFPDGTRYEGNFKNNAWSGVGILYLPNGDRWEGGFKNNYPNGSGRWVDSKGNITEGTMIQGQFFEGRSVMPSSSNTSDNGNTTNNGSGDNTTTFTVTVSSDATKSVMKLNLIAPKLKRPKNLPRSM